MKFSKVVRELHRWLSILFTGIVAAIFALLGFGSEPAEWVYFLPLPPLLLMMVSGLYLFFRPYAAFRRVVP
ncbi:MAG: hypothetical protein U0S50_00955 [Sphingopyxis sp.]|uniref:hypothetical protein n=1 Tax=Sphingopyxis sp. TaxID=1908224 RepID=UPI002ABAEF4B|nr:hypothetical protein [Sphingopyxis sp.]MDZ3830367.1 hypothetical protein [Sphingopyxis sp.]